MKDEEASLVPCTANLLAKSEVSSTASFIASNGDVLQLRKNKPSFVIEDDSSMMEEIGPVHHSSSSSDLPIIWYKDGEGTGSLVALLSALYALVLIIFSVIFELSILLKAKRITEMPWLYECFHIYLYSAGLAFFGYCYGFMLHRGWIRDIRTKDQRIRGSLRSRFSKKNLSESQSEPVNFPRNRRLSRAAISHSGPTAGSLYLRLGCVVFGIVCVVSIGMQIFECVDIDEHAEHKQIRCSSLRIIKLSLATIFTFMQMHFVFQNSKVTIHRGKNVARFGTMHLIAVNLWVWVRTVILEEYEVSREIDNAQYENAHALFVPLSNVNLSKVQKIGSSEESGEHDKFQTSHGDDDDILHLVMGCANTESCFMRQTFGPIMSTCTIEYSLIAACVMYVLWRNIGMPISAEHKARKRSLRVDCSSSTTGMFAGLVFLVGTFVSMIIFYSKMSTNRDADALWVFSLTHTALYLASIVACIFGIWRMRAMSYDSDRHATGAKLLEDILLIVGLIGQLLFSISGIVGLAGASQRDDVSPALYAVLGAHAVRLLQVLLQTVFILGASQLVATTSKLQATKPGREIVTFMMVVNMALFLVNTFEGQKASVNRALVDFYGIETWALVVQSTMPLSIFYRFHSSVCLAEIWKHSYRVHVRPITL